MTVEEQPGNPRHATTTSRVATTHTLPPHSLSLFSIISVKAKSFADREIRYTLKAQGQGAGTFNIGPSSGIVKLAKELDFEDLRQPHVYSLIVTATEDSGGFSTSVEVCYIVYIGFIIYIMPIPFTAHHTRNGCQ